MSEEWTEQEEEEYWDCYEENDADLLTYFNNPELVMRDEAEEIFFLLKKHSMHTVLPLFDQMTIESLYTFLYE